MIHSTWFILYESFSFIRYESYEKLDFWWNSRNPKRKNAELNNLELDMFHKYFCSNYWSFSTFAALEILTFSVNYSQHFYLKLNWTARHRILRNDLIDRCMTSFYLEKDFWYYTFSFPSERFDLGISSYF